MRNYSPGRIESKYKNLLEMLALIKKWFGRLKRPVTLDDPFEKHVRRARREQSSDILSNRAPSYARVILEELFAMAREESLPVFISVGEIHPDIDLMLTKLISDDINTHIIAPDDTSSVAKVGKNVKITHRSKLHAVIVGGKAFRLETHKVFHSGVFTFNDKSITSYLLNDVFGVR